MVDEKKSDNPGVEITVPDWVNAALIQKALHNSGEKDLQVKNVSVTAATAAGDNYVSTIYRVKTALSDGSERSYLVKGPPEGDAMAELTKESGIFQQEAIMLAEVVPLIEAILEEVAPGKFSSFAPRCPLHSFEPVEFLVMEDLVPQGFKMADRKRGLDLPHSLIAVRTLAHYHAASHALLRRQPKLADKIPNAWAKFNGSLDPLIEIRVQVAIDACRSWPGFEEYAGLLEKYKIHAARTPQNVIDIKPRVLDVITHGDCWVNNMMFRYEGDNPEPRGFRLVDFQLSSVSSPTFDLLQFLNTSVNETVSANNEEFLIHEYYTTLKDTLSLLRLEAPSLEALKADLNARGVLAPVCSLVWIPMMRAQSFDVEASFAGDSSDINSVYEDPAVKTWMQRVLPEYKRRGWL